MTTITQNAPISFDGSSLIGGSSGGVSERTIQPPTIEELKAMQPQVVIDPEPLEPPAPTLEELLPSESADTNAEEVVKEEPAADEPVYEPGSVEAFTGGKFKTVEDLAKAYNNSAKVYQANQDLEKQIKDFTSTPEEYVLPSKLQLTDAQKADLISIATNASLSQGHFQKLCEQYENRLNARHEQLEKNKAALGKEKINLLYDYYKQRHPEKVVEVLMTAAIENPEIAKEALSHRESTLANTPPGINNVARATSQTISEEEYQRISMAHFNNPNSKQAQEAFIKAASLRAQQRGQ